MGNSYVEISYVKRFQFHMCKYHVEISYVKRFQFHMWKFDVEISYVKRFQFHMWNFICENFTYEIFVRYVYVIFKRRNSQNAQVFSTHTCSLDSLEGKESTGFRRIVLRLVVPRTALRFYLIVRSQCNALKQYLK